MSISATYFGHSTFSFELPDGRVLLIDPWVGQNPICPDHLKQFDRIDIMALTNGHFDHIADAVPLAMQHQPEVVAIFELGNWLERKGVEKVAAMNKGGTVDFEGLRLTMVHADSSSGISDGDAMIYGGEPVGFVIEAPGCPCIYYAGDTAVFGDMALIQELYRPEIAILPIGGHYTMSPRGAAKAVQLLQPQVVIPMSFGTFPLLTGTPDQLAQELHGSGSSVEMRALEPGERTVLGR